MYNEDCGYKKNKEVKTQRIQNVLREYELELRN